jgi:hypothetical protein
MSTVQDSQLWAELARLKTTLPADSTFLTNLEAILDSRYVPLAGGVLLGSTIAAVTTATITTLTWDNEISDPDGWHAAGSGTLIVPAGHAGRHIVTCNGIWSAAPGAASGIACVGTVGVGKYETVAGAAAVFTYFAPTLTFMVTFAVGDTFTFQGYQSSGANRGLVSRLEIAPV